VVAYPGSGSHSSIEPEGVSGLVLGALLLSACSLVPKGVAGADARSAASTASAPAPPQSAGLATQPSPDETLLAEPQTTPGQTSQPPLILRGWLSIVWNDRAHFFLTDDQGVTVELDLPEELTRPLGGPLALDRRRVVVIVAAATGALEPLPVQSIALEGEG
jgi:hypothetical protein